MGCKLLEPAIELGYILVIVGVGVDAAIVKYKGSVNFDLPAEFAAATFHRYVLPACKVTV